MSVEVTSNVWLHGFEADIVLKVVSRQASARRPLRDGTGVKVFRRSGRVLRRCALTFVDSAGAFSNGVDYRGAYR